MVTTTATGIRPGDLVLATATACTVAFVVARSVAGPLFGLVAPVGVVLALRAHLRRRAASRRDEFVQQLPELARTLSNAVGAGLALRSAVALAADDLPDPSGAEMRYVRDRMAVGESVEEALAAVLFLVRRTTDIEV